MGEVVSRELLTHHQATPTRMQALHPEGVVEAEQIDRNQKAVVVDIARAGILPSAVFYDALNVLLDPSQVRQDHVFMNRVTDQDGQVTGVDLSGSKVGGTIQDATVIVPEVSAGDES